MITPKIGDKYMLCETATFESLDGGVIRLAAYEMSDEKQGEWADGPHPYEDDPLIITVDAVILDGTVKVPVFTDTNQGIAQVAWEDPMGRWYKTDVSNLRHI